MKKLEDYKGYILMGGGTVAHRMANQLNNTDLKLIGVADNYNDEDRVIKVFNNYNIKNLKMFKEEIENDEYCVILAVNAFTSFDIINYYCEISNNKMEKLFLPNPYTCLRPCVMNDDFASETRIKTDSPVYEDVRNMFKDDISLKIYDKLWKSKTYDSAEDSYELVTYTEIEDMYFCSEAYWDTYDFSNTSGEWATVLDCGAYIGDSIIPICDSIPEKKINYYAFEPDKKNSDFIKRNHEFEKKCSNIVVIECGVGDKNETKSFDYQDGGGTDGGRFLDNNDGANELVIRKIDDLELDIKGKLYIKMDIEGSELSALKGGEKIIRKYKPYLAICIYHRKNDMITIPQYIDGLECDYDYYLRGGFHTILWAIPKKK